MLLPAATKLWPRLCFYTCLWFYPQGGSLENPPRDQADPPGRENPHRTRETPLDQGEPPGARENPPQDQGEPPRNQGDPNPPRYQGEAPPPPGPGTPPLPRRKKTAPYGQWAAGTHPTGMHSCFNMCILTFIAQIRQPISIWCGLHGVSDVGMKLFTKLRMLHVT